MRKFTWLIWLFSGIIILEIHACRYSVEPAPVTALNCDQNPKNYNSDVAPIINAQCVVCHQPGGAYSSLPLTNYDEVRLAADTGKLLKTINHDPAVVAMPQGGAKMSDRDISIIECWASKGYPQ